MKASKLLSGALSRIGGKPVATIARCSDAVALTAHRSPLRRASPSIAAVLTGARAASRGPDDGAGDGHVVIHQADGHAPERVAVDEVRRAIGRIDVPDEPAARLLAARGALLLADDGDAGRERVEPRDKQVLARPVELCH